MITYIIAISITVFLAYFVKEDKMNIYGGIGLHKFCKLKMNKQGETVLKVLCVLPLFLVSALRYGIGTDYFHTYYDGFRRVNEGNNYDGFEFGFKILNILLGKISSDPQIVFVVTSALFCFFTFYAIYNLSPDILLSVVLLIISRNYFISMNIVRQFVAMAIILYSLKYLFAEKYFEYLCFIVLASSFHYSAIICLSFIVFEKIKISDKKIYAGIGMILIIALSINILDINKIFGYLFKFTKYAKHFLNLHLYTSRQFAIFTFLYNFVLLIVFCIPIKKNRQNKAYKFYLLMQVCATVLCIFMPLIPLIERIYFYFQFVQIISIPIVLKLINNRATRGILKYIILFFLLSYCIFDIFIRRDHEVVPYISIFSRSVRIWN